MKFACLAESPTKLVLQAINAQLTFVADDNGQILKVVLHQAGQNHDARRVE